ncbi:hypothetical protein KAR29_06420 [Aminithiophilus ramosus]|uniref:Uncharacterized protein n=1 Tax=Aminithiophilus ramosus TaxID=3029084 RepID=A0A9Q7AQU5_9BACT|nr:three component ABC system middle component [Aminithiophilus ramosus]QTX33493.1 hypothetical protein KAR29_06420 [Aminithiophilus ramosus]
MTTTPWNERPLEHARLLNPAFLGTLLWSCARAYSLEAIVNQPFALSFLVVPVVLHKSTRESLPTTTRTSLVAWLGKNPRVLVGFSERAKSLVPLVKEALLFASSGGLLRVEDARVVAGVRPRSMARFEREATDEVRACIKQAEFVGKWFALSGEYATVMALWGVAP